MKPKIVKPHPAHIRSRVEWWCVTRKGCYSGGAASPGTIREQAFYMRDRYRERGEDATVYEVTVSFRPRRVEKRR